MMIQRVGSMIPPKVFCGSDHLPEPTIEKILNYIKRVGPFILLAASITTIAICAVLSCPIIIGLAGTISLISMAIIFYNCKLKSDPNSNHRIGKMWEIKELVDSSEISLILSRVFQDLNNLKIETPAYPSKKVIDVIKEFYKDTYQDQVSKWISELSVGLCFGQTHVQIKHTLKALDFDRNALYFIPKRDRKDVIYYQILSNIMMDCRFNAHQIRSEGSLNYENVANELEKSYEALNLHLLSSSLAAPISTFKISRLEIQPNDHIKVYREKIKKYLSEFSESVRITGWIQLSGGPEKSHMCWFGSLDGKFFLQDTIGSECGGLFEFSTEDLFISGLQKQFYQKYKHYNKAAIIFIGKKRF